jgi:hypothetical protein
VVSPHKDSDRYRRVAADIFFASPPRRWNDGALGALTRVRKPRNERMLLARIEKSIDANFAEHPGAADKR